MGNHGCSLRPRWPQRFIELQKVNRGPICRRWFEMRGNQKLPQIFSNTVEPGFGCGIVAGKLAQKWIAHAQASVSASSFGPTTSGGGHQSASQKSRNEVWLPARKTLEQLLKMKIENENSVGRGKINTAGTSLRSVRSPAQSC